MSDSFQKRQNAFEAKFQNDQETIFKTRARTAKKFGLWVAKEMGLGDAEAAEYADQLIDLGMKDPRFDAVVEHVKKDLPDFNEARLEVELERCQDEAQASIAAEMAKKESA
ncbi:MAG: DUF1476 domain-containing protein [Micavibrio sp.]|nr:MAG: DUF1476 domain-containing protein [Micavibrio sp.]